MAWTNPKTWTSGEIVTAALLNTHLRDNLLEAAPSKVLAIGDLTQGSGANTLARLPIGGTGALLRVTGGLLAYLSMGSALQQLRVNAGATDLEWASTGGLQRVGGNTTEATTTATAATDLMTVTGLSIPAATPFLVLANVRKSAGAASRGMGIGIKLNTTVVLTPNAGILAPLSSSDEASSGLFIGFFGSRVTNYLRSHYLTAIGSGPTGSGQWQAPVSGAQITDMPTATITDVILRTTNTDALITIGVDEMHVFTLPTA